MNAFYASRGFGALAARRRLPLGVALVVDTALLAGRLELDHAEYERGYVDERDALAGMLEVEATIVVDVP